MLSNLNDDIIIQILAPLDVEDILSFRLTSMHFASVTRLHTVWNNALIYHVLSQDIPVVRSIPDPETTGRTIFPQHELASYPATELERITRTALIADRNWCSEKPVRKSSSLVMLKIRQLYILQFLPIRTPSGEIVEEDEGRYLISYHSSMVPYMQVWDVESTGPKAFAGIGYWNKMGGTIGAVMDEGNGMREPVPRACLRNERGAFLALSMRALELPLYSFTYLLQILQFTPLHSSSRPRSNFYDVRSFTTHAPVSVWALCGRLIALQMYVRGENTGHRYRVLKVVDWVRSTAIFTEGTPEAGVEHANKSGDRTEVAVELVSSTCDGEIPGILKVHFAHDYVLVFRETVLEMYFVPPSALQLHSAENRDHTHALHPVAVYEWTRKIDSLVATERVSWMHDCAAARCMICGGQGYINNNEDVSSLLSEEKDKRKEVDEDTDWSQRTVCICRYRPISIVVTFGDPSLRCLFEHHVLHVSCDTASIPYVLPPMLVHEIPVRLLQDEYPAPALGRFGTLICTDELYIDKEATEVSERAVGRRLSLPDPPRTQSGPPPAAPPVKTITMSEFGSRVEKGWFGFALCECKGRIVAGDEEDGTLKVWNYL
ncbi:hypothetical protein M0805_008852 [Coniferiporia weirii]|nr:hypothetical protein M0805_008852 [Coniferiporia weirii]